MPPAETPAGGTTALAAFGVAVIAVHIVDDNFVQPQPGTSARDHLVSGLVPLAVLALRRGGVPASQRRWSRGGRVGAGRVRHRGRQRGRLLHNRPGPLGRRLHRAPRRLRRSGASRRRSGDAVDDAAEAMEPVAEGTPDEP